MPLRHLLYIATLFKRMIDSALLYREKKVMLPRPVFIVFYNGKEEFPEYQEFRLSDSYLGEKKKDEEDALQAVVKVYNINNGKNAKILKKSETLRQYSRFVEIMRKHKQTEELTNEVMVKIMNQCQEEGVLVDFLQKYGTEIIEMLFKELTREEDLEISRLDGYDAGEKAGFAKGEQVGAERGAAQKQREIAKEMKRENIAQDVIAKVTGLNAEEIEAL